MIRFENVSKVYPGQEHPALDNVNLEIEKGEFVFLVGLSGSGKSTFLRLVLREERPTTGTIHVAGKDLNTLPNHKVPELRRQVGTVFQDFRLLPNKTITENVAFALHVLGHSQKEINREVPEVLELVGLEDKGDRKPSEISGGEQQRVAIARAYVTKPPILIADEPTTALDVTVQAQILKLIKDLQVEFNMAVVLITHDLGVVAEVADRVNVMYAGRIVEQSKIDDTFYKPDHPYTIGLLQSIPRVGKSERLHAIPGQPPSLIHLPEGCSFRARCEFANQVSGNLCATEMPALLEKSPSHFSRCHLTEAQLKKAREAVI